MTFDKRSSEYQNYLIARGHKPSTVKRQFSEVRNKTRAKARTKQEKQDKVSDVKFITTYNPTLPNIIKIIQNNLSIFHTDEDMKKLFPLNSLLYTEEKRILRKFYLLPYFHLNLTKMKVISVIVINVISARIILYLTINLKVRLLVE